jgi:hypothetical protein
MGLKEQFLEKWNRYFPGAELPLVFYYADEVDPAQAAPKAADWQCVICDLGRVRQGKSTAFDIDAIGCGGGRRYFGLSQEIRPNFEYFLSCGLAGEMEGIRFKKTPELVRKMQEYQPPFEAPGRYIVFKRWDKMNEDDQPVAVIFFAPPDVLSGLFAVANFEEATPFGVIAPSCSGCSAIVYYPIMESQSSHPRAVLGMFDTSARPCVPADVLSFAIPYAKFVNMINNMDESNLTSEAWIKMRERISRHRPGQAGD